MPEAMLTERQKLTALGHRFYSRAEWSPKAGDFYTTSRPDLELYKVVDVRDGVVTTTYLPEGGETSEWPEDGFLTDGFGPCRVWVPDFILEQGA